MTLKFKCKNCAEDIIVTFLKIGETAQCNNCGAENEVPETAIQTDEKRPSITKPPVKAPEEQAYEKAIQKISKDIVNQMKCPNCAESKISTQTITIERKPRKVGHLVGGLALFLFGLILAVVFISSLLSPVVMRHSNPASVGMVAAFLLTFGFILITRYFGIVKTTLYKCRCDTCRHQWEDKESATIISLVQGLNDEDKGVRQTTVQALGKTGDARAVEPLILAAHDKSWMVRSLALGELKKIKDKRAVEPLIRALQDEKDDVRSWAAEVLGDIGDERALEALTAATEDKSDSVRRVAKRALKKIKKM